jgi:tetratricopeptide (TPR) repeat protein
VQLAAEFPTEESYKQEAATIELRLNKLRPFGLGQNAADAGQHEVAAKAFRDCLTIDKVIRNEFIAPTDPFDRAVSGVRLADELRALGKREEAEQAYGEAVVDCDLLSGYPPDRVYPVFVVAWKARALASRGILRAGSGRLDLAETDLRQALDLVDALKPEDQSVTLVFLHDRARVRSALGNVLWATERRREATDLFRAAEKEWRQAKSTPARDNQLAWFLATCPDAQFRNAKDAVELAQKAARGIPEKDPWRVLGVIDHCAWDCHRTLGVALYRAEKWEAARDALWKAETLRMGWMGLRLRGVPSSPPSVNFFLAMTLWQLGDNETARRAYASAVSWMNKNHRPNDEELRRFREEAAQLLGVEAKND